MITASINIHDPIDVYSPSSIFTFPLGSTAPQWRPTRSVSAAPWTEIHVRLRAPRCCSHMSPLAPYAAPLTPISVRNRMNQEPTGYMSWNMLQQPLFNSLSDTPTTRPTRSMSQTGALLVQADLENELVLWPLSVCDGGGGGGGGGGRGGRRLWTL